MSIVDKYCVMLWITSKGLLAVPLSSGSIVGQESGQGLQRLEVSGWSLPHAEAFPAQLGNLN